MPGLLGRDRRQRVAELRLVIEVDRGDGRGDGRDDVGGVEAAAEPDFEHGDVDARVAEQLERDGGRRTRRRSGGVERARRDAAARRPR